MPDELQHLKKTDLGLEVCYTAPLAYLFGWISGVALLFLERNNSYVRFHAAQSIAWFGGLSLVGFVFGVIPLLGALVGLGIGFVAMVTWVLMIYRAWNDSRTGTPMRLPIASGIADKILDAMG